MDTILLLSLFVVLSGIILFFFFRKKEFRANPEKIVEAMAPFIFPGGEPQIEEGAHEIIKLLRGKVTFAEAKEIYIQKTKNFFFERFDPSNDDLRVYLKDKEHHKVNYFDKIELYDFFVDENERLKKQFWVHGFCMGQVIPDKKESRDHVKIIDANDSFFDILSPTANQRRGGNAANTKPGLPDNIQHDLIRISKQGSLLEKSFSSGNGRESIHIIAYSSRPGRFVAFFNSPSFPGHFERKTA